MIVLGIDPGNFETGFLFLDTAGNIRAFGKMSNIDFRQVIKKNISLIDKVVIEMIAGYGTVGKTVFDTCIWIGRFTELLKSLKPAIEINQVYRKTIAAYICDNPKANDSAVRLALIDRYEPGIDPKKKPQGKLKGISKDVWSALALATYNVDVLNKKVEPNWVP